MRAALDVFVESFAGDPLPGQAELERGLIAHFPLDATQPDHRAPAGVAVANTADPGTTGWIEEYAVFEPGHRGQAFAYDGNNGLFLGGPQGAFESSDPFSFSLWLRFPEPFEKADVFTKARLAFPRERGYLL